MGKRDDFRAAIAAILAAAFFVSSPALSDDGRETAVAARSAAFAPGTDIVLVNDETLGSETPSLPKHFVRPRNEKSHGPEGRVFERAGSLTPETLGSVVRLNATSSSTATSSSISAPPASQPGASSGGNAFGGISNGILGGLKAF